MNYGVFPWENKHDSHWTFVPECPCEKFMNWPFFGLVCRGDSWLFGHFQGKLKIYQGFSVRSLAGVVAEPFWRQDRKILSPHGSRPNNKDRGRKIGSQKAIVAVCFGLLGPCHTMIVCPEIKQNSHRIAKQFLRHYRFLLQRSCCLSRDRRQLSFCPYRTHPHPHRVLGKRGENTKKTKRFLAWTFPRICP